MDSDSKPGSFAPLTCSIIRVVPYLGWGPQQHWPRALVPAHCTPSGLGAAGHAEAVVDAHVNVKDR